MPHPILATYIRRYPGGPYALSAALGCSPWTVLKWCAYAEGRPAGSAPSPVFARALVAHAGEALHLEDIY
jgi:hypothetical protein